MLLAELARFAPRDTTERNEMKLQSLEEILKELEQFNYNYDSFRPAIDKETIKTVETISHTIKIKKIRKGEL